MAASQKDLPKIDSSELKELTEKLMTACRILDHEGVTDGYGHVSVRVHVGSILGDISRLQTDVVTRRPQQQGGCDMNQFTETLPGSALAAFFGGKQPIKNPARGGVPKVAADCNQNAGTTAPWYFSWMNCFTASLCRALASFCMAALSLLSGRATRMFT